MDRRGFLSSSVAGLVGAAGSKEICSAVEAIGFKPWIGAAEELFPAQTLPELACAQFSASGFAKPVCGFVHRKDNPATCGLPLGGISTGCLDLDTDGTFGYCSIFNSHVPRRGPLKQPFLGLHVGGRTWALTTQKMQGVENASEIHYWGHYPVVDLEYETTAPVSVGLRAWSPFIPGDTAISNTPAAVFEVRLRNTTKEAQQGTLGFNFPGPTQAEAQISPDSPRINVGLYNGTDAWELQATEMVPAKRQTVEGEVNGVSVTSSRGVGYTLGVIGDEKPRIGGPLRQYGGFWAGLGSIGGKSAETEFGTALGVDFDIAAGETKTVRFVLAWYSPLWKGEGKHCFTHMYATRYPSSLAVAQLVACEQGSLLRRVLAWQQAIYTEERLPIWLRESLVNILHLITETSLWAAAKPPIGDWCRAEDGLFAMNESPRECPQMECIPCSFYGNLPIVYFFPNLALSTLRGYKAYQFPDGAAPWVFGGVTANPPTDGSEMATPNRGYQTTTNGPSYVDMVRRYWLRTRDDRVLREFHESVKKNTTFTMGLVPGPEGIISTYKDGEWIEHLKFEGMAAHVGGIHLANLRTAEAIAERVGDEAFAGQCQEWFGQGSNLMEDKMWTSGYYLNAYNLKTGEKSYQVFAYQLDGQWMTDFQGLPGVFRSDRVTTALATIKRTCASLSSYGVAAVATADGTLPDLKRFTDIRTKGFYVTPLYMLAMTYIYHGDEDFGLEMARRCVGTIISKGRTWDQPNSLNRETGDLINGFDYYQNLMLWSFPAALAGQDLSGPCTAGGLVDRILQAGKKA